MPDRAVELQDINEDIEKFLAVAGTVTQGTLPPVTAQQFCELLREIQQAGLLVSQDLATANTDPELRRYRRNLERLRGVLPLVEIQLRLEQARLKAECEAIDSACDWAAASQATSNHSR
jgi:hypothetical protein